MLVHGEVVNSGNAGFCYLAIDECECKLDGSIGIYCRTHYGQSVFCLLEAGRYVRQEGSEVIVSMEPSSWMRKLRTPFIGTRLIADISQGKNGFFAQNWVLEREAEKAQDKADEYKALAERNLRVLTAA